MLDTEQSALYGVETNRLNVQLHRNRDSFSADFHFALTADEFANLKSQYAASRLALGYKDRAVTLERPYRRNQTSVISDSLFPRKRNNHLRRRQSPEREPCPIRGGLFLSAPSFSC